MNEDYEKKLSLLILSIFVLSGFLFSSCKKEKTQVNMVVKNWTLDSKTVAGINVATACEANSKWNFKADETYVITDNCGSVETGTWRLDGDGKTLTLDGVNAYSVIENSIVKLVIELKMGEVGLIRWSFN